MPSNKNKHGLSREIPAAVKRQVRSNCGFGCVVCGSAIYDYEHHSPEFKNATEHSPKGITLLCPLHHEQKQKGLLSHEAYQEAISNPYALNQGMAHTYWTPGSFAPQVIVGSCAFTGGTSVVRVGDKTLLGFEEPEEEGSPPRLIFHVYDEDNNEIFAINHNEIVVPNAAFDVESTGHSWKVNSARNKVDLRIRFDPPTRITISSLKLHYKKWRLSVGSGMFSLTYDGETQMKINGFMHISGPCLFELNPDNKESATKNMTLHGKRSPAPLGSIPTPDGSFKINWPVFIVEREGNPLIKEINGEKHFNSYLYRRFAEDNCPIGYNVRAIDEGEWVQILRNILLSNDAKYIGLNIGADDFATTIHPEEYFKILYASKIKYC